MTNGDVSGPAGGLSSGAAAPQFWLLSVANTGNAPQVWSAIANLVISLLRIHRVTSYTAETRRCAQDPRRALQILDLTALSPG